MYVAIYMVVSYESAFFFINSIFHFHKPCHLQVMLNPIDFCDLEKVTQMNEYVDRSDPNALLTSTNKYRNLH